MELFFGLVVLGLFIDHGLTNISKGHQERAKATVILARELKEISIRIGGRR